MAVKKSDLSEKLEPMGEAVKKASAKVGDAVKAAAKMAEPTVKAAVEKAEPTVTKAVEKAKPTVKKAEKAIKKTGRKAAAALVPEVYLQWGGREVLTEELVEKAKADFKAQHKGAIRSCKLYVKPEDGMVYYVINGQAGKVAL
jgi:F0F1-type ATP synthase membrane subunit b/b'